jgi:hypothetical protein
VSQISVHGAASDVWTTTPSIHSSTLETAPVTVGVSETTPTSGGSSGSVTTGGGGGGVCETTTTAASAMRPSTPTARTASTCRPFSSSAVSHAHVYGACATLARTTPSTRKSTCAAGSPVVAAVSGTSPLTVWPSVSPGIATSSARGGGTVPAR